MHINVYMYLCVGKMVRLVLMSFSLLIATVWERLLGLKLPIAYCLKGKVRDAIATHTAEEGWSASLAG